MGGDPIGYFRSERPIFSDANQVLPLDFLNPIFSDIASVFIKTPDSLDACSLGVELSPSLCHRFFHFVLLVRSIAISFQYLVINILRFSSHAARAVTITVSKSSRACRSVRSWIKQVLSFPIHPLGADVPQALCLDNESFR
jgi:hypothetical protein